MVDDVNVVDGVVDKMVDRLNPLIVISINSMRLDQSFQSAGDQKKNSLLH